MSASKVTSTSIGEFAYQVNFGIERNASADFCDDRLFLVAPGDDRLAIWLDPAMTESRMSQTFDGPTYVAIGANTTDASLKKIVARFGIPLEDLTRFRGVVRRQQVTEGVKPLGYIDYAMQPFWRPVLFELADRAPGSVSLGQEFPLPGALMTKADACNAARAEAEARGGLGFHVRWEGEPRR